MVTITNPKTHKGLIALFLMALLFSFEAVAQNEVAIGSATTKSNAILWLNGNGSQGLILPVVTNKSAVSNPDKGMVVYDDSDNKVWYRSNSAWVEVGSGTGATTTNLNLLLQGNQLQLRDGTTVQSTVNIAAGTQTNGAFLVFTGGSWQYATLSGDVTGANGALVVNGIKGKTIATLPATTQALVYDPSANAGAGGWSFQALTGTAVPTLNNGQLLTGNGTTNTATTITGDATLSGGAITISNNAITTAKISANAVDATKLADNAVTTAKISDATITGADIAGSTITADKLAQSAATTGQILKWNGTNWVPQNETTGTTTILSNGQILTGNGTANAATTLSGDATLSGGALTIGNNAITTAKINAAAVDATKLADNSVTSTKISDATITGADIANTTITGGNIAAATITADKLAQSAAATGQVLKWNGTNWVPQNDDAGTGSTPTLSNGQILVGNGTTNSAIALSGDATLSGGVITIGSNAITAAEITDASITGADLATNIAISTTGNVSVNAPGIISGIGSGLTTLNATNISSGSLALARITAGTNGQVLTTVAGVPAWQTSGAGATTLDGLSDATVTAASSGQLLVNDGAGQFKNVSMSGDATINSTGAVTLNNGASTRTNLGLGSLATLSTVDLAGGNVTGILPVANGGTGRSTWDGLLLGSAGNISDISTGTNGQFLQALAGTPSWQTLAVTSTDITDGTITDVDINSAAAIAGTKVSPAFGTQNISTTGRIGIGTTSPRSKLEIQSGDIILSGDAASPNDPPDINFVTLTNVIKAKIWTSQTTNTLWISTSTDPTNNRYLTLDPSGNFGFSNTTPTEKVDITGNVKFSGALMPNNSAGTAGQVLASAGAGLPPTWTTASGATLINNTGTNNLFAGDLVATAGTDNAIFGYQAGAANTGSYNVIMGTQAAQSKTTGDLSTIIGWYAGRVGAAHQGNTLVGAQAGLNTTGSSNTALGEKSGQANTTGASNVFVGNSAGDTNTTSGQLTIIGNNADVGVATGLVNATALGYRASVNQSNSLVLGSINGVNSATADTKVGIGTSTPNYLLHVNDGSNTQGALQITAGTGTGSSSLDGLILTSNSSASNILNRENTNLNLGTSGITRLTITSAGNIGLGNTAPNAQVQLATNTANRKLVLYDVNNNDHGFYGFGVESGAIRYQTQSTLSNHRFYAGTSTTTSALLMTISGGGNVAITGSLSKGSGTFKIDHPLDPENKYLYHSFIESPDMMNVYNGNIITNEQGEVAVTLPDYFEALNKDFRYQLTVIGTFAQAIVYKKIENNKFVIKTDKPNVEVSWQVTGIRKDPFAEKNRVVPEVEKTADEKGKYLHPEAYGQPIEKKIGSVNHELKQQ